jgi:hypothetical protein
MANANVRTRNRACRSSPLITLQRGRKAGYNNYSLQEQMHLCTIAEAILPLGHMMWERVAERFNAERQRNPPERDWESLRRKFRSLYGKPKPTGRNGVIPPRLKPVLLAKETQHQIELEGGVRLTHDGPDGGEDDEDFVQTVALATGKASASPAARQWPDSDDDGNRGDLQNSQAACTGDENSQPMST